MAEKTRVRSFSLSSEYPVERWFGFEILDHDPKSIRMDFMKSGRAPLLMSHDQRVVLGVIENFSIGKDKVSRASARFGRAERSEEALRDVDDGILVNTSAGYRVHELRFESSKEGVDTFRIVDWEPLEGSLVGIPADPSVGVGRAIADDDSQSREVRAVRPSESPAENAETTEVIRMSDKDKNAPAGETADKKVTAVEAEKERRQAILDLCKSNRIDSRVEARWIEEGTPLTVVAKELLDVMEERGKQRPAIASELGLSKSETQRFSLFRVIRHLKAPANPGLAKDASFELDCSQQLAKKLQRDGASSVFIPAEILTRALPVDVMQRAMATTPGAKGGYLVNTENMGFIDILRNRSVARALGARVLSGLEGNVVFPRQTGKSSVTWQGGEGASVTATDQALGQLSMTPKTAIIVTDVSEQLLRQSSPSAEQFITADLASSIAIDGVDAATINGSGGAQPLGIKNTTGVTTGQDAATATYAKVLAFVTTAGAANAIRGRPGFVTNIAGAAVLAQKSRFANTDTPLWEGNLLDGSLVGFPAMSSEQLASGNLIFGSWDELVIGEWGVLELSTDTGGTRFNQAQVGIRAMWMVDVMLRYPQSFVVSTNLSA